MPPLTSAAAPLVRESRSWRVSGQKNNGFSTYGFYGPMNLNRFEGSIAQIQSPQLAVCCWFHCHLIWLPKDSCLRGITVIYNGV